MSEERNDKPARSVLEYVLVILIVAVVVAVALITLGESRENYLEGQPGRDGNGELKTPG